MTEGGTLTPWGFQGSSTVLPIPNYSRVASGRGRASGLCSPSPRSTAETSAQATLLGRPNKVSLRSPEPGTTEGPFFFYAIKDLVVVRGAKLKEGVL